MRTFIQKWLGNTPSEIRDALRNARTDSMKRRRAIVMWSLAGMAGMAAVSLLQTGVVRHLPDPPIRGFRSDDANLSEAAFQFGIPDGSLSLASLAVNIPLAALGGADRARRLPWVPVASAAKSAADAAGAGWYLYKMATRQEPWCAYCIASAVSSFVVLALTLPEATEGVSELSGR